MELSHRVVMVLSAQVQQQTNKTASEMLSSLKFKSLPSLKLFNKSIATIRPTYIELFNMSCLKWVSGFSNYLEQLAATHTLPFSFYLVYQDMLFFDKTNLGNYDLNIKDFICFSHPAEDLRSSKFIHFFPVMPCHKFKTQECSRDSAATLTTCQQSIFLSSMTSTASGGTFLFIFIIECLPLT